MQELCHSRNLVCPSDRFVIQLITARRGRVTNEHVQGLQLLIESVHNWEFVWVRHNPCTNRDLTFKNPWLPRAAEEEQLRCPVRAGSSQWHHTGQTFIRSLRNVIPNLQLRGMPGLLKAPGAWGGVGSNVLCLMRAEGSLRTLCSGAGGCRAWLPSAPLDSCVGRLLVQGIVSSPQLPLVSVPTFPLILVIPNLISTDLIFTSKSWMNMLNIIIR